MFAEIRNYFQELWLFAYDIGENYIRGKNGTEFFFVASTMEAIKRCRRLLIEDCLNHHCGS